MKKMFSFIISGFLWFVVFSLSLVNAQSAWWFTNQNTTYNPDTPLSSSLQGDKLIVVIKTVINRLLWLLALIALVILLWGGFQMVTAAGDDGKYKKWFKILQQAGMWLLFIWVSWLFVSVIFWIINQFVK